MSNSSSALIVVPLPSCPLAVRPVPPLTATAPCAPCHLRLNTVCVAPNSLPFTPYCPSPHQSKRRLSSRRPPPPWLKPTPSSSPWPSSSPPPSTRPPLSPRPRSAATVANSSTRSFQRSPECPLTHCHETGAAGAGWSASAMSGSHRSRLATGFFWEFSQLRRCQPCHQRS